MSDQASRPEVARIGLRKRFRLFFIVIAVVLALVLAKAAIHALDLEFLTINALFPSIVASAVFIIGFLLSSILSDYKEAERMPSEIRMALEAIHDDAVYFAEKTPAFEIESLRRTLLAIVAALQDGLRAKGGHSDLEAAIAHIDRLTPSFAEMERLGISQNFMVRLRGAQDVLRRCLFRIYQIQKTQFVPSVHVLVQTLVLATLFLLLFLKTEGSVESALMLGFVSYMFVYSLYLVDTLEQPFRKGSHSVDDVSIFLLRDFVEKIGKPTGSVSVLATHAPQTPDREAATPRNNAA
jgi:hypothetical protein